MKNKFSLGIIALLISTLAYTAVVDKFDTITTNSPTKTKVDFLKGIKFTNTDSLKFPVGTTGQRDASPVDGLIRQNSTTSSLEHYVSGAWKSILTFTSNLSVPVEMDMNSHKIVNVTNPTGPQDASTKSYVDTTVAAIDLTAYVDRTTNQTVGGTKTFSSTIAGSINGNAATVTTNANLVGEVTSVGNTATLVNSAVTGQPITGYSSAAGTVAATDTILQALNKMNGNIAAAGGNLTGPISATAGVSSITSQTGTGTKFVVDNSPTIITPTFSGTAIGSISGNAATVTTNANLTGEVVSTGNAATVPNATVIGKVLAGYSSSAGTVASTDTIVGAIGKLNGNDALKIPNAIVTAKGNIVGATGSGVPTAVAVGSDFQVLQADSAAASGLSYATPGFRDLSTIAQYFGQEAINTWTGGNNASPLGGGVMNSVLVKETVSPITKTPSYKFTLDATSSLNDYFFTPAFSVPAGTTGTYYLSFPYNYNGATGDLRVFVYDVTGTATSAALGNNPDIVASNGTTTAVYSLTIPPGMTSGRIGFQVKVANASKVFNFGNINLSSSLYPTANLNNTTKKIPYTAILTNFGTSPSQDCYQSREGEFVNVDCIIIVGSSLGSGEPRIGLPDLVVTSAFTGSFRNAGGNWGRSASAQAKGGITLVKPSVNYVNLGNNDLFSGNVANGLTMVTNASAALVSGDTIFVTARVSIASFDAGGSAVVTPVQQVSSDTMILTQKTTAIVSTDPAGTYNSYSYVNGSNAATLCTTAPTQTATNMNTNGVLITARGYTTTMGCSTPARYDIYIGSRLKDYSTNAYAATAKATSIAYNLLFATSEYGTKVKYDETTGILSIDAGTVTSQAATKYVGSSFVSSTEASGYFVFSASTTPSIAALPLLNELHYSGFVSDTGGVVSGDRRNLISGPCVYATNKSTCTFNKTQRAKLNCTCNSGDAASAANITCGYDYAGSSTTAAIFWTSANAALAQRSYNFQCDGPIP